MLKTIATSFIKSQVRMMSGTAYKTLAVTQPLPFVHQVELNRPDKLNAFSHTMWLELKQCFDTLNENPDCRAIVLSGSGKVFTAGLDLKTAVATGQQMGEIEEAARRGHFIEKRLKEYQEAMSSLELCTRPVIAAVHSACIGAGVSLITAADIRYCTEDSYFTVKEIDIGLAADVGALQRLPKVVGNQSWARELCFTGRNFDSKEALSFGLVSRIFANREEVIKASLEVAEQIASKSPVALQATKRSLVYSLDHTNQEGLDHIKYLNRLNLIGDDFLEAAMAQAIKSKPPTFAKL